jgi:hypothetical protein
MKLHGTKCMWNMSGTELEQKRHGIGLRGLDVETAGWVNFVCG